MNCAILGPKFDEEMHGIDAVHLGITRRYILMSIPNSCDVKRQPTERNRSVTVKITHLMVELKHCTAKISNSKFVQRALIKAVRKTRLTVLHSHFHGFRPRGTTGLILLRESHVTIHTWPEHGYASVDIVTCGNPKDATVAFESIVNSFRPKNVVCKKVRRGLGV
jgi:S-adenosylmethionine decarboxylase